MSEVVIEDSAVTGGHELSCKDRVAMKAYSGTGAIASKTSSVSVSLAVCTFCQTSLPPSFKADILPDIHQHMREEPFRGCFYKAALTSGTQELLSARKHAERISVSSDDEGIKSARKKNQ